MFGFQTYVWLSTPYVELMEGLIQLRQYFLLCLLYKGETLETAKEAGPLAFN